MSVISPRSLGVAIAAPPFAPRAPAVGGGRSLRLWLAGCVLLVVLLRLPWITAPLSVDEGGVAYVVSGAGGGHFPYGHYFLDRPPLLVLLYTVALIGGDLGIRVLGMLAAAAVVVTVGLIARRVAGVPAARCAAVVAAALCGSGAIQIVYTTAEALAIVPGALSVLCVVVAVQEPRRARHLLFAAGALAMASLLVKQSFGDALIAGCAALAFVSPGDVRRRVTLAGAYFAGAATPVVAMEIWERLAHVKNGAMSYALLGFRLDGFKALAGSETGIFDRMPRLLLPFLGSGLIVALVCAALGARLLRSRTPVFAALAAWLACGIAGILAGGSYWPHYLIQIVPATAVLAGTALAARGGRAMKGTLALLVACSVAGAALGLVAGASSDQRATLRVSHFVRANDRPGDTMYVLYARANVLHSVGLPSPFPYDWSLMMRTIPGAQQRLRTLLRSPARPTWIVQWQKTTAFSLDKDHVTQRLVARDYRVAATVCNRRVWLRRDAWAGRHIAVPPVGRCVSPGPPV
jgi:hypothetical protein